ncbi:FeoA family protein [Marinisporobacter balticus]|uniref:Ferrous iron transport protein A n=1 Tax=Marinisporobacter balticus TaxID=2018667 RepID=A0A4R2KVY1_9FIRM|nr:ferrous iron transport protein A [Marinisporobacter balticus]
MASILVSEVMTGTYEFEDSGGDSVKNLSEAKVDVEYTIREIETNDNELKSFLFTLGCYEGETVTVISVLAENYVISVKDARYSIDWELAKAIIV